MKIIDYTIPCTTEYNLNGYLSCHYDIEKLLFFDIETTGFIAKHTTLYLIGVLWYENNNLYIRQWFNEDGNSENDILLSFITFCQSYTHLVHFNGLGFDLPYLKQKADNLSISFTLEHSLSQIDIYKAIRPYKNVFALDNMKQVSIEKYLSIQREDTYSGKELINIYQKYVTKPHTDLEELLLLHNHDDLLGMTKVCQILQYKSFFENPTIHTVETTVTDNQLIITFSYDAAFTLPKRISVSQNGMYLNALDCNGKLYIPLSKDTLKHFFSDYKNYYYLPLEDTAIHKSVATYVEASNKIKASKQTCYIKKTDSFIPCFNKDVADVFQQEFNSKQLFQTLDSFLNSELEYQISYIKKTLLAFI